MIPLIYNNAAQKIASSIMWIYYNALFKNENSTVVNQWEKYYRHSCEKYDRKKAEAESDASRVPPHLLLKSS